MNENKIQLPNTNNNTINTNFISFTKIQKYKNKKYNEKNQTSNE